MQHRKKVAAQKWRYLKINNLFDKWLQKTWEHNEALFCVHEAVHKLNIDTLIPRGVKHQKQPFKD